MKKNRICHHKLRGLRGGVLAAALLACVILCSLEAHADSNYVSLAGEDRYQTALRLSEVGFGPGVEGVVVADGEDPLCATASAVLAAAYGGPLLLTPGDRLDPRVTAELWRLGPDRVFVVGTDASVARGLARAFPEWAEVGRVVMLCGVDGSETALLVAEQVDQRRDVDGVVVVSREYAQSAPGPIGSVSVVAAAKSWPLIFVPSSGAVDGRTSATVERFSPESVVRVGTSAEMDAEAQTTDLRGKDAYELGARIAEYAHSVGLSYAHTMVLSGSDDSAGLVLAVGAYMAPTQGIAILTSAGGVPTETLKILTGLVGTPEKVDFCGSSTGAQKRVRLLLEAEAIPAGFASTSLKQGSEGGGVAWLEQRLADLSYRPGPVDGVYDRRTRQAVIAFQKWEGLSRDGVVGNQTWWQLLEAERPVPAYAEEGKKNAPEGSWIEVDKERQVLLYCVDGIVERTLAVSTGNPSVGVATPSGLFWVRRENTHERVRYKPLYLSKTTVLAIHGYTSVPTYPASHGCIRMTWADMDEFHDLIPVGTPVLVY